MRGPKFFLALWASKGIAHVIDIVAKGRGTNLPGAVALKIDPAFLAHIRGIDPEKTVFITGTNGKSTATNLLSRVLTEAGFSVVSNLDGANMTPGVAVPLLRNCTLWGRLRNRDSYVVMETDERYVARIRQQLPAKYLCVTNIQKDQVQRNGEPSFILEKIRSAIQPDMTVFLNHDDPNSKGLGVSGGIYYGVAANEKSFQKEGDFFSVSMPCPVCHNGLQFERYNLDNVGLFRCPVCGLNNEDSPEYMVSRVSFEEKWMEIDGVVYPFRCNMSEFLYSYAMVVAVAGTLGIDAAAISRGFEKYERNYGHGAIKAAGDRKIKYFRMKQENSETLQSAVNLIVGDKKPKTLIFGLDEYIDFYPPYINGCYLYDCFFRRLRDSGVERCICTSRGLGHWGALRFLYDGFSPQTTDVIDDSEEKTLVKAMGDSQNVYLVEEIPFWKR